VNYLVAIGKASLGILAIMEQLLLNLQASFGC
jgi:hypothetical protein